MSATPLAESPATRHLDFAILIAILVCGWQLLYLWVGEAALTSPLATLRHAWELLFDPDFRKNAVASLDAFGQALVISYVLGVGLGLVLGFYRFPGEVAEPMLAAFYSLPKVTLYPVILLIFGLGVSAKVAFGVIHGFVPVTMFCMNAVRNVNTSHLRTARVMRLSPFVTVRTIIMPSIIPEIFTGLRVGFSLTLLGVLIGEMFASQRGLGFLLINAINLADVKLIMALIFLLFLFASLANGIMLAVDRRLHVNV